MTLPITPPKVINIRFTRNDEHEAAVLFAWKRREHPAWSQHATTVRIGEAA